MQPYSMLYPLAFACLLAAGILLTGIELATILVRESGPVESSTVICYGAVIAALFIYRPGGDRRFIWHSACVVGLLMARELDLNREFTTGSILSLRYYTGTATSAVDKVVAGLVVLAIIWILLRYLPNALSLRKALRDGKAWAYSLATAICLLPISKVLDAAPRVFRKDFGIVFSPALRITDVVFEEVLELAIPMLMLWAIWQYVIARGPTPGDVPP